jgi:hypothetical protein
MQAKHGGYTTQFQWLEKKSQCQKLDEDDMWAEDMSPW